MKLLLFLINPFLSGIHSLLRIKEKNALLFLYLWFVVFGIGFVAKNEKADSFRYVEDFELQCNTIKDKQSYLIEIKDYFTFNSDTSDIYVLTVNYLVSRFTHNYHWTFFIYAIVFGYFYIRSIKYLIPYLSKTAFSLILLFLFCFSNPIFNINGVRFWTAAWVGVYAVFRIFIDKKYIYYLLLVLTPLIHGAFLIWIGIVVIAHLVPKVKSIWVALYILSLFVSLESQVDLLSNYIDLLPKFFSNMLWHYTLEETYEKYDYENSPLYAQILRALPNLMLITLTLILIIKRKILETDGKSDSLVDKYIIITTIVNFLSAIPTIGVRFQQMTIPVLVLIWAKYSVKLKETNNVLYLVPLAYSYAIFYWIRYMISVTELYLYAFPAPLTIFKYLSL